MNRSLVGAKELGESLQNFGITDYIVFVLMLVGCAGIGLYYGLRGKKNVDAETELLMGGRNMKVFPIAMSLVARLVYFIWNLKIHCFLFAFRLNHYCSFISGITLLGNPTEAYLHGTQYFFIIFTLLVISFPGTVVFLPVFHDMKLASTYEVGGGFFFFSFPFKLFFVFDILSVYSNFFYLESSKKINRLHNLILFQYLERRFDRKLRYLGSVSFTIGLVRKFNIFFSNIN